MKIIQTIALLFISLAVNAQMEKVALISVFGDRNLSDNPLETKIYEALM